MIKRVPVADASWISISLVRCISHLSLSGRSSPAASFFPSAIFLSLFFPEARCPPRWKSFGPIARCTCASEGRYVKPNPLPGHRDLSRRGRGRRRERERERERETVKRIVPPSVFSRTLARAKALRARLGGQLHARGITRISSLSLPPSVRV